MEEREGDVVWSVVGHATGGMPPSTLGGTTDPSGGPPPTPPEAPPEAPPTPPEAPPEAHQQGGGTGETKILLVRKPISSKTASE